LLVFCFLLAWLDFAGLVFTAVNLKPLNGFFCSSIVDQSTLRFFEPVFAASGVADSGAFLGVALDLRPGMTTACRSAEKVWVGDC
jgi:hypothetical protein